MRLSVDRVRMIAVAPGKNARDVSPRSSPIDKPQYVGKHNRFDEMMVEAGRPPVTSVGGLPGF
jgi:hypothetical protein